VLCLQLQGSLSNTSIKAGDNLDPIPKQKEDTANIFFFENRSSFP